jgi:hypothetical protein
MLAKKLRRGPAAKYVRDAYGLECSEASLEKLASIGGGPLFYRIGRRVEYDPADLDAWALSRISGPLRKTSDQPFVPDANSASVGLNHNARAVAQGRQRDGP